MTETPNVLFRFENNNIRPALPSLGITNVVARTTKGKFNEPILCENLTQFKSIFGKELVPDGTVSNIERALYLGSKLRICRVSGATEVELGIAKGYIPATGVIAATETEINIILEDPAATANKITIKYKLKTKEAGSNIVSEFGYNLDRNFYLKLFEVITMGISKVYITQFLTFDSTFEVDNNSILNTSLLLSSTAAAGGSVPLMVDPASLREFIQNTPNITLEFVSATSAGAATIYTTSDVYDAETSLNILEDKKDWLTVLKVGTTSLDTPLYQIMNEGDNGGDSDKETWVDAYDAIKGEDAYNLILSHVHQHLSTDYTSLYKTVAKEVNTVFDTRLFVEVPKLGADGLLRNASATKIAALTMMSTIGYFKNVSYFAGGIKLTNEQGLIKNCDVLGTVVGLSDNCNSNYGPYYSFANQNRGLVPDSKGPCMENLGSPAMFSLLNEFANAKLNIFVIKDTESYGKQTMLWHNFTSTYVDSSDKFMSVVGLQLYLKKTLKPKLEKYLEEPNTFGTWKDMYLSNKKVFEDLIGIAITEFTWIGDQFATKYSAMVLNKEADVRAGKYKIKVTYKDIVTLQIIEVMLAIDRASGEVTIN